MASRWPWGLERLLVLAALLPGALHAAVPAGLALTADDSRQAWQRQLAWPTALCPAQSPSSESSGVRVVPIDATQRWVRVECRRLGPQSTQLVYLQDRAGQHLLNFTQFDAARPALKRYRSPLLLGTVAFDPGARTLSVLRAYRGIGDCGQHLVYAAGTATTRLTALRERACPSLPEDTPPPPEQWPLRQP